MIIEWVWLRDWKGIVDRKFEFGPGLNMIVGPNERGKSTLAEAISIALQPLKGAQASKIIQSIIPRRNTAGRPTLDMQCRLADKVVRISRTLHKDAGKRDFSLQIETGTGIETITDQTRIFEWINQHLSNRFGNLLVNVSRQNEHHQLFTSSEDPTSKHLIDMITIEQASSILPSSRLERIRNRLDTDIGRQIAKKISPDGQVQFKANTEGARLTAELDDVRESIEECNGLADTLLAMIEQINQLAVELQTSQQFRQDAETNRQRLHERYHQQQELILQRNKLRDDLTRLEQEQRSTEQASQSQERLAEKIKSAMRDQQEIALRRAELAKQLEAERGKLSAIDASKAEIEQELQSLSRQSDILDARRRFLRAEREQQNVTEHIKRLDTFRSEYETNKQQLAELAQAPSRKHIDQWQRQHQQILLLAGKLQSQLGVDIVAREQVTITCQSDDEPETQWQLDASEPVTLKGARTIRIQTPSLQLTIRSGSQEVATLLAEHDRLTVLFNRDLAPFNITADSFVDQLPHMQQLADNLARLQEEQKRLDRLSLELQQRGDDRKSSLTKLEELNRRMAVIEKELAGLPPISLLLEQVEAELEKLREKQRSIEHKQRTTTDTHRIGAKQIASLEAELNRLTQKEAALEANLKEWQSQRAEHTRMKNLEPINPLFDNPDTLKLSISDLAQQLLPLETRLKELGPTISKADVDRAEERVDNLRKQVHALELKQTELRAQLLLQAKQDPRSRLEELAVRKAELEQLLAAERAKVEGMVVLRDSLESLRRRITRQISEPLNRRLSGVLTKLRGVPTQVVVNEQLGQVTDLIYGADHDRQQVPFASLSEGMKEQLALLVRTSVAQLLSRNDPARPVLVLDDPLTETSDDRISPLFEVLAETAHESQILYLTCHQDLLQHVRPDTKVLQV